MGVLCRIMSVLCGIAGLVFACLHEIDSVLVMWVLAVYFQLHAMDR